MVLPENLTRHHTLPRSRGGRHTELICRSCHTQVHALFTTRQLARELSSLEALRNHPDFAHYLAWVKDKNPDRYFKGSTRRKR